MSKSSVGDNTVEVGNVAKGVEIPFSELAFAAKEIRLLRIFDHYTSDRVFKHRGVGDSAVIVNAAAGKESNVGIIARKYGFGITANAGIRLNGDLTAGADGLDTHSGGLKCKL